MPNFREGLNSVYWKIDHPFYLGYIFRRVWPFPLILSLWPFFNQYANPFFAMALALVYSSLKVNINYNKFLFVQLIPLFEESKSWMFGTQVFLHRTNFIKTTEAYSEPCHTSKKELTLKIVNCVKPLTIHKTLLLRCLAGFWIHLWTTRLNLTLSSSVFQVGQKRKS